MSTIVEQDDKEQERMISIMKLDDIETSQRAVLVRQSVRYFTLTQDHQSPGLITLCCNAGYFRKFPGLSVR